MLETVTVVFDKKSQRQLLNRPRFVLRVLQGEDKGLELKSARSRVVLGSGQGVDLKFSDRTVSALHAEIVVDEEGFLLRDLGAKNGTRIGGRRVREAWLEAKEQLSLGRTTLSFRILN